MTTKTDSKIKFVPVNEAGFSEKRKKDLAKLREAMQHFNTLKNEWNAALIADNRKSGNIPSGHTLRISHVSPWGVVGVAVALVPENEPKAKKASTGGMDLS
jgi:hypothetical protein